MKIILSIAAGIAAGIGATFAWLMWYFRDVMK